MGSESRSYAPLVVEIKNNNKNKNEIIKRVYVPDNGWIMLNCTAGKPASTKPQK